MKLSKNNIQFQMNETAHDFFYIVDKYDKSVVSFFFNYFIKKFVDNCIALR